MEADFTKVGSLKVGFLEIGSFKVGLVKVGFVKFSSLEVDLGQECIAQVGSTQVSTVEGNNKPRSIEQLSTI